MLTKVSIRYVMKYVYITIFNLFYTSFSEYLQWKHKESFINTFIRNLRHW